MKLKICPRCDWKAFEELKTYSICHDCNFNTEEGYSWAKKNNQRKGSNEVKPNPTIWNDGTKFTMSDYVVVRQLLMKLTVTERKVITLKFWNGSAIDEIAKAIGATISEVEDILERTLEKLKAQCMNQPDFSRSNQALLLAAA